MKFQRKKKRDIRDIIYEMLKMYAYDKFKNATTTMRKVNISSQGWTYYSTEIIRRGLGHKVLGKVKVTEKGHKFLKAYEEMKEAFEV